MDNQQTSLRELGERLALAFLGAVAVTAERADQLADDLADRGVLSRDDARTVVRDATSRWRGDAVRMGERASLALEGLFRELNLVTREDYDELELRVAQVEHRLRLLESDRDGAPVPGAGATTSAEPAPPVH